ncbi:aminotransferase class III-fold pyridoxal phosphate-dependent enzyme [Rossellomorea sp. H39__3]
MIGIGLESEAGGIIADLRENGLLTLPAGPKVIRLLPPLTVSRDEIDQAVTKVEEALGKATAVV